MPASKRQTLSEEPHSHYWIQNNSAESYCRNLYKGKSCQAIKIGEREYNRRKAEWEAYFMAVGASDSYLDFKEMEIAYKEKNLPKMTEIKTQVETRCQVVVDELGDNRFSFDNSRYMTKPSFPDPAGNFPYIVETV